VNTAKVVYVARDQGITKGTGLDPEQISVQFDLQYGNGATAGSFSVPAGASDGTSGWLANKPTVAKFVNRAAPGGPTDARIVVVKPGTLIKLVGRSLGDTALDLTGAADPGTQGVDTIFRVTNGPETHRHCSHFSECSYKVLGSGTGAKLVCRPGAPATCP
jgi:hypothetical protein